MDLKITNYNNRFKIKGALNKVNLKKFQNHFDHVFDEFDDVLLDLKHVDIVDRNGVKALAKLHNESITKSKRLSSLGSGCNELFEYLKAEQTD